MQLMLLLPACAITGTCSMMAPLSGWRHPGGQVLGLRCKAVHGSCAGQSSTKELQRQYKAVEGSCGGSGSTRAVHCQYKSVQSPRAGQSSTKAVQSSTGLTCRPRRPLSQQVCEPDAAAVLLADAGAATRPSAARRTGRHRPLPQRHQAPAAAPGSALAAHSPHDPATANTSSSPQQQQGELMAKLMVA